MNIVFVYMNHCNNIHSLVMVDVLGGVLVKTTIIIENSYCLNI